jgi:hypothetical protein
VAVEVRPEGAHAVEVAVALDVDEIVALATRDNEWLLGLVHAHLREGVPHVPAVQLAEPLDLVLVHLWLPRITTHHRGTEDTENDRGTTYNC